MRTDHAFIASRVEESVLRFFSPNGLLTVVSLVILAALLLGGMGIERRTMDGPIAEYGQVVESPLLSSAR